MCLCTRQEEQAMAMMGKSANESKSTFSVALSSHECTCEMHKAK